MSTITPERPLPAEATLTAPGGTALSCTVSEGAGGPVLALHGLSGAKASFAPVLEQAAADRPTWALDFRGHGTSGHTPGGYAFADYVGDAVTALEAIGEPTVVVGHSLGALVATTLAQAAHPLVRAVFLEDPPSFVVAPDAFDAGSFAPVFRVLHEHVGCLQAEGAPVEAYEDLIGAAPHPAGGTNRERLLPDALTARAEGLATLDPDVFVAMLDRRSLTGFTPDAPMQGPVLVVRADPACDAAFLPEHQDRLRASTPQADVRAVPGTGHNIRGERAGRARYLELLSGFLAEHG